MQHSFRAACGVFASFTLIAAPLAPARQRFTTFRLVASKRSSIVGSTISKERKCELTSPSLSWRTNSPHELSALLEHPTDQTKQAETFKFKSKKTCSFVERKIIKHGEIIQKRNPDRCIITKHLSMARFRAESNI
jgi:hypothetical protein